MATSTPTRMEIFPTKREFDAELDEEAAAASKKAKTTEEARSDDEIMADSSPEQEEAIPEDDSMSDSSTDEKEWIKTKLELEALRKESRLMSYQDALPTIDLTREFQLFLQLNGYADRASKIASEKDARYVFSEDEMEMFWSRDKLWHIRRQTSDNFSDYQRLAIYASESDPFYQKYFHHYYFDSDFDALYLKIADEPSKCETIQWDTTSSDAYRIAEAIWKRCMPLVVRSELIELAVERSSRRQATKELVPVFVDLCKRGVETKEDYVLAIEVIIEKMGIDRFPFCKDLVEEALQKQEGLASSSLWHRYRVMMMSLGNVQIRQAALSESKLKDLITDYFEGDPKDFSGPEYFDYVKEKTRIAKELGIL